MDNITYYTLTTETYRVCQYSARWDSNLLRKRASRPEAMPFAIHVAILGGWEILRTVGWTTNRAPKSLVKSTGLESKIWPEKHSFTNWMSSFTWNKRRLTRQLEIKLSVIMWINHIDYYSRKAFSPNAIIPTISWFLCHMGKEKQWFPWLVCNSFINNKTYVLSI